MRYLGFKQIDELPDLFAACDVLICPSRYDGWGVVVAEGMGAGMPVIATSATGAAIDMLQHGQNGMLFEAGSVEGLRESMASLIEQPDRVESMGQAARERSREYDCRVGARRIVSLSSP